jgi:hypothetical protein
MTALSFVLVDESTSASALKSQVTPDWLASVAAATTVQLDRDVSPNWGGEYSVRVGVAGSIAAGEIVFALVDVLPAAPGAIAYHDVDGNARPVAFLALSTCSTLDDVSIAISHEVCETAGDPGCNLWADDGSGAEWARELCDAVESSSYDIQGVRVSDFVLPSFFEANARGPYSYVESTTGSAIIPAPFRTASGGYQITRTDSGQETQVNGRVRPHRADKLSHWSSRAARRKLQS